MLIREFSNECKYEKKNSEKRDLVSIIKEYRLPRRLSLFTFLYSLLWFVAMSLVATKFEESEYNLTSLYGSLDVASAILTTASAAFLYPRICNKIGLGRIYLVTCFAFAGFTFLYLGFPTLTVGILIYVGYRLIDGSIHSIALANQLTLYPGGERDQIRLMSDILAQSAGFFMVGFLFLLPGKILLVGICVVVIAFVCLGISASKKFDADILFFLRSSDHELKSNAIALFDQFDSEEYFNELRRIIKGDQPVDLKIEVIEILGKAIHPEGLPIVLDIIDDDSYCLPVKIAALSYLGKIKTTHVDPFQKFRMTEALRNIQMGRCAHSKVLKAYAIKNLMTHNPNEETFQLLRQSLLDKDTRVVANAIEGLGYLNYLGVYSILLPFLERPEGRVRANTCIALWKYMRLRPQVNVVITEMLESDDAGIVASGVFAVGEIRDTTRIETLKNLLNSGHQTEELLRGLPIALAKLSCAVSIGRLIDMILGEDEGRALSVAYLALGLDSKILNEDIIANIYSRGPEARSLGWKRFSECGAFCHEQLELLGGAVTETHHFALS